MAISIRLPDLERRLANRRTHRPDQGFYIKGGDCRADRRSRGFLPGAEDADYDASENARYRR
jgi:hypothetical protein